MTDLTDRMRTCAAHILATTSDEPRILTRVMLDAADLLINASNLLEPTTQADVRVALGEPMPILDPVSPSQPGPPPIPVWTAPGETLPTGKPSLRNPRACPQCDSRTNKRVDRVGNKLMLTCPVCSTRWEWQRGNPT